MILTLRTDKPESEIGLFEDGKEAVYLKWQAHRQLAETIHQKIKDALDSQNKKPEDVKGIVVYAGPGSFTGLRIGTSVANALAYSLQIPVVGVGGSNWQLDGITQIESGEDSKIVVPEYGSAAHVTQPKK